MSLNQSLFLISQNSIADLKGPKQNINCTMVDVRGDVLRPPHGTTPAAVKSNKNKKRDPLRAMKTFTRRKVGHTT